MTSPKFSALPVVHCPEWAPKAVQAEFATVSEARQVVEAKRAEVLEALHKARNQDLAVFTPVRYDGRPMLQQELLFRRAVVVYLWNLMAAASIHKDKCIADAERAREEVRKRLLKAGFIEPADVPGRGAYTPEMVNRHELVRCATEKCDNASAFDMNAKIRENELAITDLESKLSALREAVLS